MTEIDPEMLMAYADGELDPLRAKRVEKAIAKHPALAAKVEAHRALRATLSAHFDPVTDQPVPDRLRALLDVPAIPVAAPPRRWLSASSVAAMAATLVLGLAIGGSLDLNPPPVGERGGALVAQSGLADALETQLASAQPADAETRIGLTFRDKAGAVCRSFEGEAMSGIACRAGDGWQVRQLMGSAAQRTDYRQAGSPEILMAAETMMADSPLDADAERAARDGGWK